MKDIKAHFWYYLVTFVIFACGLVLIVSVNYNHKLQSLFVIMVAVLYFIWSLLHHYVHHQLHYRIVLEYALMISLGVVISMLLFNV